MLKATVVFASFQLRLVDERLNSCALYLSNHFKMGTKDLVKFSNCLLSPVCLCQPFDGFLSSESCPARTWLTPLDNQSRPRILSRDMRQPIRGCVTKGHYFLLNAKYLEPCKHAPDWLIFVMGYNLRQSNAPHRLHEYSIQFDITDMDTKISVILIEALCFHFQN